MVTDEAGSNQDKINGFRWSRWFQVATLYLVSVQIQPSMVVFQWIMSIPTWIGNSSDEHATQCHRCPWQCRVGQWITFPDPTGASMNLDPVLWMRPTMMMCHWCEGLSSIAVTIGTVTSDLGTPGMANDTCPPPPPPALSYAGCRTTLGSHGLSRWWVLVPYLLTSATSGDFRGNIHLQIHQWLSVVMRLVHISIRRWLVQRVPVVQWVAIQIQQTLLLSNSGSMMVHNHNCSIQHMHMLPVFDRQFCLDE